MHDNELVLDKRKKESINLFNDALSNKIDMEHLNFKCQWWINYLDF
jgi:hypothetical protein